MFRLKKSSSSLIKSGINWKCKDRTTASTQGHGQTPFIEAKWGQLLLSLFVEPVILYNSTLEST